MRRVPTNLVLILIAAGTTACVPKPEDCANRNVLTGQIAGQVYQFRQDDFAMPVAKKGKDVFFVLPSRRHARSLLWCQRRGKMPVELSSIRLKPQVLKPMVVDIELDEGRSTANKTNWEDVIAQNWRPIRAKRADEKAFSIGLSDKLTIWCNTYTGKDFRGRNQRELCMTMFPMRSGGRIFVQFLSPDESGQSRDIFKSVETYLKSHRVSH